MVLNYSKITTPCNLLKAKPAKAKPAKEQELVIVQYRLGNYMYIKLTIPCNIYKLITRLYEL